MDKFGAGMMAGASIMYLVCAAASVTERMKNRKQVEKLKDELARAKCACLLMRAGYKYDEAWDKAHLKFKPD